MEDDGAADDFQVQSEEATTTEVKQGDIEKATTTGVSEMAPETKALQTPVTPLNTPVSLVNGQAVLAYSLREEFEEQRKRQTLSSDQEAMPLASDKAEAAKKCVLKDCLKPKHSNFKYCKPHHRAHENVFRNTFPNARAKGKAKAKAKSKQGRKSAGGAKTGDADMQDESNDEDEHIKEEQRIYYKVFGRGRNPGDLQLQEKILDYYVENILNVEPVARNSKKASVKLTSFVQGEGAIKLTSFVQCESN